MEEKNAQPLTAFTLRRVGIFLSLWFCSFLAYLIIFLSYNGGKWGRAFSAESFFVFPYGLLGGFHALRGGNYLWWFTMISHDWIHAALAGLWMLYLVMAVGFFLPLGKSAAVKWGLALGGVLFLNFVGNWAVFASLDEVGH